MYNVPPVNLGHFNITKLSTRTRAQRSEKILRPVLAGQLAPCTAEFPMELPPVPATPPEAKSALQHFKVSS